MLWPQLPQQPNASDLVFTAEFQFPLLHIQFKISHNFIAVIFQPSKHPNRDCLH